MPDTSAVPSPSTAPVDGSAGPSGEAARRYGALFDQSSDAVCVHDFQGRFIDANDAALRLIGYAREELPGLSFAHLLDDAQLPTAIALLQEIISSGRQSQPAVFRLKRKDGSFVEVEMRAAAIELEGHPTVVLGIAREIADHTRADEALRESEQRFRMLAENMAEAFWLLDPKDYQVVYVSPAYEELWGRTCESLYEDPRSWLAAIHPADIERVSAALERQAETGEFAEEFRIVRPDGSIRWVSAVMRSHGCRLISTTAVDSRIGETT